MSKYIIDIPDDVQYVLLNGKADNKYYTAVHPIAELEELNSDYINEHFGELQDEAYQAGLNDAWEAAKKIVGDTDHGGIAMGTLCEIFDTRSYSFIMRENTAREAIAKLKAYEDGNHSDRIEVGDEVISDTGTKKFTVTVFANSDTVCGISERGLWCFSAIDKLKKTGKHYDIASILEAMKS